MEEDEQFLNELEKIKLKPSYLNSKDFTKSVKEETEKYTKLAETTGIRK
jgi:tripartite-type tricarboxylate transporter receptor subunit TctC